MKVRTLLVREWLTCAAVILMLAVACGRAAVSTTQPEEPATGGVSHEAATPGSTPTATPTPKDAGTTPEQDPILAELDSEPATRIEEVPACNRLAGAEQCTGVGAVMLACVGLGNIFEPSVTPRLTACLERHQGSAALCDTRIVKTCALESVQATPVEDFALADCERLFEQCPRSAEFEELYTPELCRHGLSSLRRRSREDFLQCMEKHCELRLCVGYLL